MEKMGEEVMKRKQRCNRKKKKIRKTKKELRAVEKGKKNALITKKWIWFCFAPLFLFWVFFYLSLDSLLSITVYLPILLLFFFCSSSSSFFSFHFCSSITSSSFSSWASPLFLPTCCTSCHFSFSLFLAHAFTLHLKDFWRLEKWSPNLGWKAGHEE